MGTGGGGTRARTSRAGLCLEGGGGGTVSILLGSSRQRELLMTSARSSARNVPGTCLATDPWGCWSLVKTQRGVATRGERDRGASGREPLRPLAMRADVQVSGRHGLETDHRQLKPH